MLNLTKIDPPVHFPLRENKTKQQTNKKTL